MKKKYSISYCIKKIFLVSTVILTGDYIFAQNTSNAQNGELIIPPFKQVAERTIQNPLKSRRMLYTEADIATAQSNISTYPEAKDVKDRILKAAEVWLEWSDLDLRNLLPDARVPRAFDLSVKGCPVHGDAVFKSGRYSWVIDPKEPFKVKCPVGGEKYPDNDYETYYHSDFIKKNGWNKKYVDDGWGWKGPDGERYWFVAYANHWMWYRINSAIANLSQAYLLTDDKRYAHKAAVMLYRLAEIYPSMDHAKQSRYGLMSAATGVVYNGKIVNSIWETGLSEQTVKAYDMIWNSIDSNHALQKFYKKDGQQIRSFIEANLLEDIIDAYFQRKISGNFGMHQSTLLHTILVRENLDREKYLRMIIDEPNKTAQHSGIRYALYNSVFRDGLPYESPHYNSLWINSISEIAELVNKGGLSLYDEPRMRRLYNGEINNVAIGKFTPATGDSGSTLGEFIGARNGYKVAYNAYKDPRYLTWLSLINRNRIRKFSDFNSLFHSPQPQASLLTLAPQPSRLFAGYGLGMLNNKKDNSGLALTYGYHGSHYHWDFLNFELFANGQKMMPDLGYPDQMNNYVSGIYTWSNNTISHNTVVVDAMKQSQNKPGKLHGFFNSPFARSVDASSPAYPQTSQYRRNLIMVDIDENQSYTVDFFRVEGGKQHDYSLHGPPGVVATLNGTWTQKQQGTLAGPEVPTGHIYDNAMMSVKGYSGKFSSYQGSGFQHLFNVQRLEKGEGLIQYQHILDKNAQLRIHVLPVNQQEVYIADAFDLPVKKTHVLKYLVARRKSTSGEELKSTFVSVLEPYTSAAYIQSAQLLTLITGSGTAVEVKRSNATDVIISDTSNTIKKLNSYDIETNAANAVLTFGVNGQLERVFFSDGTFLKYKKHYFKSQSIKGTVTSINPGQHSLSVKLENNTSVDPINLSGQIAYFSNNYRTTAHPLAEITIQENHLNMKTQDDLLVGRFRTKAVTPGTITTDTNLPFYRLYNGVTMLDKNSEKATLVKEVRPGEIILAESASNSFKPDEDVWLSNLGVGDRMEIKSNFSWSIIKQ
ncbi:MAG TPA: heparinase II/III family protein [Sphingobacteriaceae bacterium]